MVITLIYECHNVKNIFFGAFSDDILELKLACISMGNWFVYATSNFIGPFWVFP